MLVLLGLLALVVLVVLEGRDLRARDAAAAKLTRRYEALRITVASIGDGVITTDVAGRVTYLNPQAEKLTGWTTAAAAGEPLERIFQILHEDTRQPVANPAVRSLREGVVVSLAERTVLISKDGVEQPIDDIAAPIRDAQGRVCGVVLIFRDVAEARTATHRLRQLAAELAEADVRKNEFLAMLAHEIRNPLAAIRSSVAALKLAGDDAQASAAAQGVIFRQMEHLVRLVEDLFDVSRISRGKLELRRSRIDLRPALEQALEAIRPTCDRHQQTLEVAIPDAPIYVDGDATRLAQAVGNLLSNASRFTPRGGTIQLRAGIESAHAVVRIRDDGIGIASEQHPRLFEMFSQIDAGPERPQSGLGIGLHLVQQLVELHGGGVEAHSDGLGTGSEFVLRIPVAGPSPEVVADRQPPAGSAAASLPPRGLRVLVVDDNLDAAESLARLLRLWGHEPQMVHDGLDAVEVALDTLPEVVLLDIGLPRLNGYEAARRIRLSLEGRPMRLIALTGWGRDEDRRESGVALFEEHLFKPVDPDRLLALLSQAA